MGRVVTRIKVENLVDVLLAEREQIAEDEIRLVDVDALVDTGAALLCLPASKISVLGLSFLEEREAITATGKVKMRVFQGARLTIMERVCTVDVIELAEDTTALVGYIPLENLDLKVNPAGQKVEPNPEHGGRMVMDLFHLLIPSSSRIDKAKRTRPGAGSVRPQPQPDPDLSSHRPASGQTQPSVQSASAEQRPTPMARATAS